MLISSDARNNASSTQLDSREAQEQLEQSYQLQLALATTAQKHNAKLKDEKKQEETEAKKLPAIKQQDNGIEVIKSTEVGNNSGSGSNDDEGDYGKAGGQGKVTAYSEAQLQLSSPAGIAITTPKDAILSAGNTSNLTASQDLNFAAQGNHHHAVRAGISLFTYGKLRKDPKEEPNTETGIKLHSGTGKVTTQSQSDKTSITADKTITVASINKEIMIAAPKHVLLTAMGAYLKLEGGNIMIHGPGTMAFNASMKELAGPASSSPVLPIFPKTEGEPGDQYFILKSHDGKPIKNRRYRASTGNQILEGLTDNSGRTKILEGYIGQIARFELLEEKFDEHFILRDSLGVPISNMRYKIRSSDGAEIQGVTDEYGRTDIFTSDKVEKVELIYIDADFPDDEGVN
jgi:uncharacterized protein (DUF2345 family)